MVRQTPLRTGPVETRAPGCASVDDRFAQLSAQFDLLKAQVRQAQQLASLGTAAATIAHEVNNLLTPILSYAEYALQADDVPLAKKALTITVRNAKMLIAMSERVLELGAAKRTSRENVNVREAVEDAIASLCRDLAKDGIELSVNVDPSLEVVADPLQMRQILFNLFLNAREAMAPNHSGRLTVTTPQNRDREGARGTRDEATKARRHEEAIADRRSTISVPNRVVLEIRNTGNPIPVELLPRIFEPFQSSKPARRNGRSRCGGLGLALVKDLVEENDGIISVTSDETSTTFVVCLPLADNSLRTDAPVIMG